MVYRISTGMAGFTAVFLQEWQKVILDKEKDPILKLRRMEGKLLLLDLKKIIWVAPLSWLMMFISLASLLFSEHQSDWKWNISSVTKSIIPFAKQFGRMPRIMFDQAAPIRLHAC